MGVDDQLASELQSRGGRTKEAAKKPRCCGGCRNPGHTIRKCPEIIEASNSSICDQSWPICSVVVQI
ncbi:hypothetical protein GQ53DRAFT_3583 [Thozetella sp. PMI_491]|nr:hypothetical protein GQ53DRAFT_3583 [Thozetella sp. PMI_491]